MSEKPGNEQSYSFKNLLEKLQEESWQLELLVSGFAIVLVASAYEPLQKMNLQANYLATSIEPNFYFKLPVTILLIGWFFLLVNLIAHVLFRGLWISTIGLRYVSGEVDYDVLKLSDRFKQFLKRRIGSFDSYIERLEKFCSIIFAFTFLIIFSFISFGLFVLTVGGISNFIRHFGEGLLGERLTGIIHIIILFVFLLSGLIYFIDFITLGFFKRKKWTARWYMPIYQLMSLITLSFIYRPIYYNFIDNKFGRRIGFLLVPYIALMGFLGSMYFQTHAYYPQVQASHLKFKPQHYDNLRRERTIVDAPSLPAPYVSNGFLEIFIPYLPVDDDERIKSICEDFEPLKKTRLKTDIVIINFNNGEDLKSAADSSFICLSGIYRLQVNDSLFTEVDYQLYQHPNHYERGLRTTLDIDYLARGRHELIVQKTKAEKKDSPSWETFSSIPFWVE